MLLFGCFGLFNELDAALLSVLAESLEADDTVSLGIQGIITADTDVFTRMDMCTALSVKDVAGLYELSVSSLSA